MKRSMSKILSLFLAVTLIFLPMLTLETGASQREAQNEEPRTVTVYFTLSNDGSFVRGNDENNTPLARVPVTVDYFDLKEYGLEEFYRYESDSFENGGGYISDRVIETPTVLHLYIKVLEDYNLNGKKLEPGVTPAGISHDFHGNQITGGQHALNISGSSRSLYMTNFWGHDENLMYYVNHAFPQMAPGVGSTSDYILLEDGMEIDVGMFSDWSFWTNGAFAFFDQREFTDVKPGTTLSFRTLKAGTMAVGDGSSGAAETIDGLVTEIYNSDWELVDSVDGIVDGAFSYTFLEDGDYFVVASDPDVGTDSSRTAPAIATVQVVSEPIETWNVAYDDNGADIGTAPVDTEEYHSENSTVTVVGGAGLEKDGAEFLAWNTKTDGSGTIYKEGDTFEIAGDVTLYATYEKEPVVDVTVTYTDGVEGENIFADQTYTVQLGMSTPEFQGDEPVREGHIFSGWNPTLRETVEESVTYIAQWSKIDEPTPEVFFNVTYTDGVSGKEVFKDQVYSVNKGGQTPLFDGTPERKGYKFIGWNPEVSETVTKDIIYQALWEKTNPSTNSGTSSSGSSSSSGLSRGGGGGGAVQATVQTTKKTARKHSYSNNQFSIDLKSAKKSLAGSDTIKLRGINYTEISKGVMQNIIEMIGQENTPILLQFDTVVDNKVVARFTLNPTKDYPANDIKLTLNKENAESMEKVFKKFFKNKVQVISLDSESFVGTLAVKLNAFEATDNLVLYKYDATTNTYQQLETNLLVDANGYAHFDITEGQNFVISAKTFAK